MAIFAHDRDFDYKDLSGDDSGKVRAGLEIIRLVDDCKTYEQLASLVEAHPKSVPPFYRSSARSSEGFCGAAQSPFLAYFDQQFYRASGRQRDGGEARLLAWVSLPDSLLQVMSKEGLRESENGFKKRSFEIPLPQRVATRFISVKFIESDSRAMVEMGDFRDPNVDIKSILVRGHVLDLLA